jgi:O-antigen/teichoic acid export membrane protein
MLMYVLAFVIGFFVSCIIWVLYTTMTAKKLPKTKLRESYSELRRLRQKK